MLGNGDIWEAADALAMMRATGCDGVVVGRGCLGRPWLFADLVAVLNGLEPAPSPLLGDVADDDAPSRDLLAGHLGENLAMRDFRKHTSWYLTGYPVGGEMRRRFSNVSHAGRARRPPRRARPVARRWSPAASASAAATPTDRSASPCRPATSTTSTTSPRPTTPT